MIFRMNSLRPLHKRDIGTAVGGSSMVMNCIRLNEAVCELRNLQ